jgi:ribosomal protein S18 acetylase RimI-like enzyme
MRDSSQIDALLARVEVEYAHLLYRQFHLDPLTPPEIEAHLMLAGFSRWSNHLVMILEEQLRATPKPIHIRQVKSEEDWFEYSILQALEHIEYNKRLGKETTLSNAEWLHYTKAKSPPVSTWMAYTEDTACGYCSSWPGENGVGQVEDLFTHPDFRHRGIATALIAHGVSDARSRGAGPVVIIADPTDTPKRMFATLGFRPLFNSRSQYP